MSSMSPQARRHARIRRARRVLKRPEEVHPCIGRAGRGTGKKDLAAASFHRRARASEPGEPVAGIPGCTRRCGAPTRTAG
eukprot:6465962-Pyramimonas_sp.AAC.1